MVSQLQRVQRAVGQLLPEAQAAQTAIFPMEQTFPVALELFYTAFAIKNAYQEGALFMARRYASRMGLDPVDVERFAALQIGEVLAEEEHPDNE